MKKYLLSSLVFFLVARLFSQSSIIRLTVDEVNELERIFRSLKQSLTESKTELTTAQTELTASRIELTEAQAELTELKTALILSSEELTQASTKLAEASESLKKLESEKAIEILLWTVGGLAIGFGLSALVNSR